ncbi:MAG: hypothetical protein RLY20_984, partial [Verrucomicrobiota bacterium]
MIRTDQCTFELCFLHLVPAIWVTRQSRDADPIEALSQIGGSGVGELVVTSRAFSCG